MTESWAGRVVTSPGEPVWRNLSSRPGGIEIAGYAPLSELNVGLRRGTRFRARVKVPSLTVHEVLGRDLGPGHVTQLAQPAHLVDVDAEVRAGAHQAVRVHRFEPVV